MTEIFVYSRPAIEAIETRNEPHIIVSVNCPGEEPARIRTSRATLGRVNLFFWDLDHKPTAGIVEYNGVKVNIHDIPDEQLVQPADAVKIIDLVEAHPEAEHILIHCTAGKSRSAAIAAALHKVLNGSDEPIFGNKRYSPNMRVYRMVLDEWYTRHPWSEHGNGHH
jgi:predicted protein tyrosine phosphatase